MPTKRKSAKKVEPEQEERRYEDTVFPGDRPGIGTNLKDMMSNETQMHVLRGFSELAMAMESMIPRSQMPEEAKRHAYAAKREMLLMVRSLIDAHLSKTPKAEEPKLHKIKVE